MLLNALLVATKTASCDPNTFSRKLSPRRSPISLFQNVQANLTEGRFKCIWFISTSSGKKSLAKYLKEQDDKVKPLTKMCSFQGFQYVL